MYLPGMPDASRLVSELEEEQRSLQDVLAGIGDEDWLTPTPAEGWDVRDSVAHLADTDEIAVDTMLGGPRSLNEEATKFASPSSRSRGASGAAR